MKLFVKLLILVFVLASCDSNDDDVQKIDDSIHVQYKVLVSLDWSKAKFPDQYPDNAHFSRLIGVVNKKGVTIFEIDQLASAGIKKMAETGDISPLDSEIDKMVMDAKALNKIIASNLSMGVGEIEFMIDISKEYSYVSLVSMIAPSPDWFIACNNVSLFIDNAFVDKKEINLMVYDSGTDSGTYFTSEDMMSEPIEKVHLLSNGIYGDGENGKDYIGTVVFTKM